MATTVKGSKGNGESRFDETAIVVPMAEVANACGVWEVAEYWRRQLKIEPVETWDGFRALRAGDARRIIMAVRDDRARRDEEEGRYFKWRADRKAAAKAKREEELRQAQAEAKAGSDARYQRWVERQRKEEEAQRAAAEAKREPSFQEWQKSQGGPS